MKRHLDGRVEEFLCDALTVTPEYAVVRFVLDREIGGYPVGTQTLGFFWRRRRYVLYRMLEPDGGPRKDRFDVVEGVTISPERLEYVDLFVDVVVERDGTAVVEDEEEMRAAWRRGLLNPAQVEQIEWTRDLLLRRHRRIIRDALKLVPTGIGQLD